MLLEQQHIENSSLSSAYKFKKSRKLTEYSKTIMLINGKKLNKEA